MNDKESQWKIKKNVIDSAIRLKLKQVKKLDIL